MNLELVTLTEDRAIITWYTGFTGNDDGLGRMSDPQRPQSIWWLTKTDFIGFRIVRAVEEQDNLKGLRSKVTRQSRNYPPMPER